MKLQIAIGRIIGACPGLSLPQTGQGLCVGQAGSGVSWRVPSAGCAGSCLPWGAAAAPELRIWRGMRSWGEGQTPPEFGEEWEEAAAACLGATSTLKDARQEGGGSKQHGHLPGASRGEGPSGEGRK